MAINLRSMYYSRRSGSNWKGSYQETVQGSLPKLVYNNHNISNTRRANPIRHWRKQSSPNGTYSNIHLMSEFEKPGHVNQSTVNQCNDSRKIVVESTLSKNSGCCSNQQTKALKLLRPGHGLGNTTFKYGNNAIDCDCTASVSNRYYHDSRNYLQRKKDKILRQEKITTPVANVPQCKLKEQCTDMNEKYFQIHGFSNNEKAVDCKC